MEGPYPVYCCITNPLNVDGVRSVESLQQQLPLPPALHPTPRRLSYPPPTPPLPSLPSLPSLPPAAT
jgi:hypothetical protein